MTTMAREISNFEDVIDSRDIIARIDELEAIEGIEDPANYDLVVEQEELATLRKLAEEGESSPDWPYGETLIRDSYFEEYAQELADDIGAINREMTWPLTCIDWEQAARELQMDYTPITFDGVTYWVRS